jgi:hypothetical protein
MFLLVAVVFERFLVDYRDPEWKHIEPFESLPQAIRELHGPQDQRASAGKSVH